MTRKAGSRVRVAEGVYRDRYGFSAVVWAGQKRVEQRFPLETDLDEITAWRLRTRADVLDGLSPKAKPIPAMGSLETDAPRFLGLLPEGGRRTTFARLLAHWARTPLAAKLRAAITRLDIKEQLSVWEDAGLSASELNHRLRAIRALYRELDGEDAPNPTTAIKKRREPHRQARAIPIEFVELILAHVPERRHSRTLTAADARAITTALQSGAQTSTLAKQYRVSDTMIRKIARRHGDVEGWDQVSHTKIRLRVMAWTSMPQMQIERLRPQDLDLERARVFLQPRKKGAGVPGVWVSLIPQAVEALRDFAAADLFGQAFSRPSMARTWTRAIEATYRDLGKTDPAKLTQLQQCLPQGCRPYDLRHSFLTDFYRQTGDIRATAEMGQHADLETTKKYTEGAVSERVAAGVAKMAAARPLPAPTPKPAALIPRLVKKR
jgi:integrase